MIVTRQSVVQQFMLYHYIQAGRQIHENWQENSKSVSLETTSSNKLIKEIPMRF